MALKGFNEVPSWWMVSDELRFPTSVLPQDLGMVVAIHKTDFGFARVSQALQLCDEGIE
jgi:hypothetical protein